MYLALVHGAARVRQGSEGLRAGVRVPVEEPRTLLGEGKKVGHRAQHV